VPAALAGMRRVDGAEVRFAAGVPNVGPFGDPLLLTDLAVAAEDSGWDGFFIWDHLLYRDQRWPVAGPTVVIAAVAARTSRVRFGVLMNQLARRRVGKVARGIGHAGPAVRWPADPRCRARVGARGVHRLRGTG
jgi:hypothetical protein